MKTSVIIPVLNEEQHIGRLVSYLKGIGAPYDPEIIVVDGGSTDKTVERAQDAGAIVKVSSVKGRAHQMNLGAQHSSGELLYFVHADVWPALTCFEDITQARKKGFLIGTFRQKFDSANPLFFINSFFTRFNKLWCRGGDQTIFVDKTLFLKLEGYNEYFTIMEEYDFLERATALTPLCIIPRYTVVSTRKYQNNGWFKVMSANYTAMKMYRNRRTPDEIKLFYKQALKN